LKRAGGPKEIGPSMRGAQKVAVGQGRLDTFRLGGRTTKCRRVAEGSKSGEGDVVERQVEKTEFHLYDREGKAGLHCSKQPGEARGEQYYFQDESKNKADHLAEVLLRSTLLGRGGDFIRRESE